MATIERRIQAIQDGIFDEDSDWWPPDPDLVAIRAAIIAGWNAAEKAMKMVVAHHDAGPFCPQCGQTDGLHRASCFVTLLQAALAAMEGDLPPDENVVE